MFTLSCPTCEAKLVAKDEKLVGKIWACPKCNSMVLVQHPDDAPTPLLHRKKNVHKRFPDALTHETLSGIIGEVPPEHRRSNLFLEEATPPEADVSDTEIKTRKVLVGMLIGLIIFLFVILGVLMFAPQSEPPQPELPPQAQEPNIRVPPEPPPPVVPELAGVIDIPPPEENLPEISLPVLQIEIASDAIKEDEEPHVPGDLRSGALSGIDDWSSEFIDLSVPNIDIDERLARSIHELKLNQVSLIGFVQAMSRLTEIPMTLDIDEMKARSLSAHTPMSGLLSEATVGEILTEALATLGLRWIATDRQLLISLNKIDSDVEVAFDVSDLAENTDDLTPEVLAGMIQKLVVPEEAVVVLPGHRLFVERSETNRSPERLQNDIQRFLEQLRLIRQLPQQTELVGEKVAPEAFGWDRVMEPMTLNYYRAVPLSRIISHLESLTGLTILVDHQSLHRAFTSFASIQATVQCDHGTVNDVMELLLASVDSAALAYRIIDHQTLEITTTEVARLPEKMVLEVHPYQLLAGETPEEIVRLLRLAIAPESWATAESPETRYGGNIVIDTPSSCLLIRQSQPVQRQIRLYLSESGLLEP